MIQVEFPWKSGLETFKRDLGWFLDQLEVGIGEDRAVHIVAGVDLKPAIAVMLNVCGYPAYDPVNGTLFNRRIHFDLTGKLHRRVSMFILSNEDLSGPSGMGAEVDAFLLRG